MAKNEIATANKANSLSTLVSKYDMSKLGYNNKDFSEKDGTAVLTCKTADGSIIEKAKPIDSESMASTKALDALNNAGFVLTLATCYNASKLNTIAENCGFKSVGAYAVANIPNSKDATTVNQYARIGELFLKEDENGNVIFNRDWLIGTTPSVLLETLSTIHSDCNDDIDKFYNDFIKSGKVSLDVAGGAKAVREQLKKARGKADSAKADSAKADSAKADKPKQMSPLSALALVNEWVQVINTDKVTEAWNLIYNDIANAMKTVEK